MKILLATRSASAFSNYQSVVEELLLNGHSVKILFDRSWSPSGGSPAVDDLMTTNRNLETDWLVRRRGIERRLSYILREFRSLASYQSREGGHKYYEERQRKYFSGSLPTWLRFLAQAYRIDRTMARSTTVFKIAGRMDRSLPISGGIKSHIEKYGPDLILATPTNLRYSNEAEYIRVGIALGIPTAIHTMTWDNLTTKGLIPITPDRFFVWNHSQSSEALEIHGIPAERIAITGSPTFDKWFERSTHSLSRTEFASEIGLSDQARYILYMGSSANISGAEGEVPVQLADALEARLGPGMGGFKIVVRPHPANEDTFSEITDSRIVVWLRSQTDPPDSPTEHSLYLAFLENAECVVGINTTGMVDAAIYGKDVITLDLPKYRGSNAREADHIKIIADSGIFFDAPSLEIAAEKAAEATTGKRVVSESQVSQFIQNYIRPVNINVPSGRVVADEIVKLVGER